MPEMKPVKNTEREHRWPQNIGVFQPVKYLHNLYGNSILGESFRQTRRRLSDLVLASHSLEIFF
jgi:hypothetical protein